MRPNLVRILLVAAAVLVVAGCGDETPVVADPAGTPYDGPMHVELDHDDRATALEASGAAGQALECAGTPRRGGGGNYDTGPATVQDSPDEALDNWLDEDWAPVPGDGYRIERVDGGRALWSWDVGDQTRVAVVVSDDIAGPDDTGWGVESWASCDPAELGVDVAEGLGFEIWTDAAGEPVPTSEVVSYPGPEHCDWQDITFVEVGAASDVDRDVDVYLSDGFGGGYPRFTTPPNDAATLPKDAVDTGWQRDGRELWLGENPQAAYLVGVDDPKDVELWPAPKEPPGCM